MDEAPPNDSASHDRWSAAEILYALALFGGAAAVLAFALDRAGGVLLRNEPAVAAFFLAFGLFTISVGYRHPNLGYYSFDRVAQVASILVLGPVDAAWINGLASFLYPWHRLLRGSPARSVLYAALNNAGLMTLIILAAGHLYTALDGPIPLTSLSGATAPALVALVLAMQLLNDVGMLTMLALGGHSLKDFFNGFTYALELGSGAAAVMVALVYNAMEPGAFVLLLCVLTLGMLALRQFAALRHKLELVIEERTRRLKEQARELETLATQDKLTGLFNRRYADQYLAKQLEHAERYQHNFTIALADIDFFKQINDRHSHATGDQVLRSVAAILRERCRRTDMIARYGGEEFLICFPHTGITEARALCEELRRAVEADDWLRFGLAHGVTISFGIAAHRPNASADTLLRNADMRLYAAKGGGRNLVVA